jgi:hypothetical protein
VSEFSLPPIKTEKLFSVAKNAKERKKLNGRKNERKKETKKLK